MDKGAGLKRLVAALQSPTLYLCKVRNKPKVRIMIGMDQMRNLSQKFLGSIFKNVKDFKTMPSCSLHTVLLLLSITPVSKDNMKTASYS